MRFVGVALVVSLILGSCGGGQSEEHSTSPMVENQASQPNADQALPTGEESTATQHIDLRHSSTDNTWTVTWTFNEPTTAVLFDRRSRVARDEWTVDESLEWGEQGPGRHTLTARDGEARSDFSATFPAAPTESVPGAPFLRDLVGGGKMIDLVTVGVHAFTEEREIREWGSERRWRLGADGGLTVQAGEHGGPGQVEWSQTDRYPASFAYVGPPIAVSHGYRLMLGDGVPEWVQQSLPAHFGTVLEQYSEWTQRTLARPPNIFVLYRAGAVSDFSGFAINGDIVVVLVGDSWSSRESSTNDTWQGLVAHETFHLFNEHAEARTNARWMVEGAADYAKDVSARRGRRISEEEFYERVAVRASVCVNELEGPLEARRATDPVDYHCGAVLLFLIDRATENAGGLFALLAELFERGDASDGYSVNDLYELVDQRTEDSSLSAYIRGVARRGMGPNGASELRSQLAAVGLETSLSVSRGRQIFQVRRTP